MLNILYPKIPGFSPSFLNWQCIGMSMFRHPPILLCLSCLPWNIHMISLLWTLFPRQNLPTHVALYQRSGAPQIPVTPALFPWFCSWYTSTWTCPLGISEWMPDMKWRIQQENPRTIPGRFSSHFWGYVPIPQLSHSFPYQTI